MTHLLPEDENPAAGEFLLYTSPDGKIRLDLRIHEETLWMTQQMMAELFQVSKQNIGQHIANVLQKGERQEDGTVKKFFTVRLEGEGTCKDFLQVRQEGHARRSITLSEIFTIMRFTAPYRHQTPGSKHSCILVPNLQFFVGSHQ